MTQIMTENVLHIAQEIDKAFAQLVKESQNYVNNLVDWFEEAKLVDKSKEALDDAKKLFSEVKDQSDVTIDEFKRVVHAIAEQQKTTFDQVSKALSEHVPKITKTLDKTFDDLEKDGKNAVHNIVEWLQDAKVIDKSKEAADKAKKMFSGVKDQSNVTIDEFKGVVNAVAQEQKTTFDKIAKTLTEQGPKLMKAFSAATSAFKDAMK